ncbi:nucleoside hydrolase [Pseudomonas coronafaciens pv. porri]|uniref:Nucleoside hydrolase n=1 Tax=Pseudomonas coronafaciens pv. porri TaxID=83964 RepID=A0ABR5JR04_9PSED|nr:nucleoside hydrolase [Pseudomonas coronafaciens]KOP56606.1 nucleoside hydrolase [Pseudomonas coronafaciens pv. porri]KOP59807.1 nucleoside hydrolase [Pseudomonas coronafaciens pv. porri]KPY23265.1 Inosine/uridine-preferring nucleoside hydrolase [Pseudomonas coronafaciens pv. porri]RMU79513.1 Inosine/uridine-preferring nucleoside hydrolase [Pseudomonas coronafaciens pv. porri]RMV94801.1 Inosine/uridine-preferring nucleoside hydrolase [Pseudomonas coronafaciens pv. porri]
MKLIQFSRQLIRGALLLSILSTAAVQAAEKRDLIIDTDPGADDVVALLLALASPQELNVMAITTVAGNVRLDKTSRNARLAREWAGREEVPVYAGTPKPLVRTPIYAENIHGQEGLPGVPIHEPAKGLAEGNAVDYLIRTLSKAKPHSITIAMLGPQTNLALALVQAPEITQGIKEVVVMGGAHFNGGNITPAAEFNLFADPHAAQIVLASGVKLTYVPLDVTHKILTSEQRLKQIAALNNNAGKLVDGILNEYVKLDMEHYGLPGGPVHDASVIAWLLKPELFTGRQINVAIDTREGIGFGQTVADWYGTLKQPQNVFWVENGDAQGFFDLLTERLARLK